MPGMFGFKMRVEVLNELKRTSANHLLSSTVITATLECGILWIPGRNQTSGLRVHAWSFTALCFGVSEQGLVSVFPIVELLQPSRAAPSCPKRQT